MAGKRERNGAVGVQSDLRWGVGNQFGGLDAEEGGQTEVVERMDGDVDLHTGVVGIEIGHDEQQLPFVLAQEGVVAVGVEVGGEGVGIHEVEEVALDDGSLVACDVEEAAVPGFQVALAVVELLAGEGAAVVPAAEGVDAPVVEDGGASVASAIALLVHAALAELLAEVDHGGAGVDGGAHEHGGQGGTAVADDEVGGEALLVVVLHEMEHVAAELTEVLPAAGDVGGRLLMADDADEGVVEAYLVVEVVELAVFDVVVVFPGVVYFGNEDDVGVLLLYNRYYPAPELEGDHLGHVAAEAVDALLGPEEEDVAHLEPGGGEGVEVGALALEVVDTVVELHGLVPVVARGVGVEAVVAGGAGGTFGVVLPVDLTAEGGAGEVVEVVLGGVEEGGVILLAEVDNALGLGVGVVAAGYVVGNEVDDHLQTGLVGALDELGELLHAVGDVGGEVGVYIVVVLDGVGGAGLALDGGLVVGADALSAIVGLRGVLDDSGVPYVGDAHLLDGGEGFGGEIGKLAASVLLDAAVRYALGVVVAEKAGKNLIKDDFIHNILFFYCL